MGNGVIGKRVKFILITAIFLTTIAIFFQSNLIYNNGYNKIPYDNQNKDKFNNHTLNTASIDPNGKPLLVKQYANISRTFTDVESNENVTFPIAPGWISKNTTIYYDGVERQKQWVTNSDFATNADHWNYVEQDTYYRFWEGGYAGWGVDGHYGSAWFGMDNGMVAEGDYAGYQQSFSISEETLTDKLVTASFEYYYVPGGSYPDASIYLKVVIGGVEKNITRHLDDISMNQWEPISIQYNAESIGQILPGSVSVFAGLYINDDSTHSDQDTIFMDNIQLTLWTNLNDTNGLIRTYDVLSETDYQYYSISEGQGYSFIDIERSTPGDVTFTIFEDISPEMDYIEFNVREVTVFSSAIKVFNTTYFGKEGSFYSLGSPVDWTTSFSISLPTYYYSWIEILKPIDWSVTSIIDGFETEQIGGCYGNEYGSSKLIIPYSIIGEGVWDIKAKSQNNIIDLNLLVWNQTQFKNRLNLTQNEIFKINLDLNSSISLQNSEVNCTIFYSNRTIFLQESLEPSSYNVNFGNYSVGKNMTVGQYLVEVTWRNDKSLQEIDQTGFANLTFSLWHHTNLTAINSYYELVASEPLLLKVSYIDIDLSIDIDFANVKFASSYGLSGTMAYQGLGIYFIDIDTSSLELGNYFFSFNASKSYYENQTKVNLIQLKIVPHPLILDFNSRIVNSTGNNYAICRVNVIGEISGSPVWPVNISSDWDNGYSIFDYGNGTYSFNFSTYELPTNGIPDTFEIEIFANKTNYESTSDFITLIVHPIPTLAHANNTNIYTYINEVFALKVNYTVQVSGALISDAECTVTWEGYYNIIPNADGFTIKYNTSGLSIDLYNSLITLSSPGYEDAVISITVVINEIPTLAHANNTNIYTYINEVFALKVNYTVQASGALISDAECTVTWEGYYNIIPNADGFTIKYNTSGLSIDLYNSLITLSSPGYEDAVISITVVINEIPTLAHANNTNISTYFNEEFELKVNYTVQASGALIGDAECIVTWEGYYNIIPNADGFTIKYYTSGLNISSYNSLITLSRSGYEDAVISILVIIKKIPTLAHANNTNISTYFNEEFELKVNYTVQASGALIGEAECTVTWEGYYNIISNADGFTIKYYTSGLNRSLYNSLITLSRPGYEDAVISIAVIINEMDVSLNVKIGSNEVSQDDLVEMFFNDKMNITAQVYSEREGKFITGGLISFLSDNYQANFTEFQPSYFGLIINIDGDYFNAGLINIYLRFEKQNYTTEIFSFQIFIRAQNVILDLEINHQTIPENYLVEKSYNDLFVISCRAFAEYDGIYLSEGTVKFILNNYEFNLTEYNNFWYNGTIGISTDQFSLGINYVYVRFELSNYTTTVFSFQILVNQIELNVQPMDFTDSLNVYSGESVLIQINLTEFGSTILIENATIYCYWEFGTYHFDYIGDGLYQLNLNLPTNLIGTYRFNLIISTNKTIYKTTEYSFLIIVSEKELPNYIGWIIFLILVIIVVILGVLSLRSYVIIPRKKKRALIIADKAQPYKDIRNIQAILVSHRTSGISLYDNIFSILDENYITGFSGFIQAITVLGKQYTKNGIKTVDVESNTDGVHEGEEEIKELDFNFFHSLICDFANVRVVLLLKERSSARLRRIIDIITREIYSRGIDILTNFDGRLTKITAIINEVLYRYLPLYYKGPFVLNKTKHYHRVKVSGMLSNIELRMLKVLESQSKYKKHFLLDDLIESLAGIGEDEKIIGVEALIMHKMIIPAVM
ncbi:MAG: hypothetical protein ACFFCV_12210 [Promethearchaeota archaeon]